MCEVLIFGILDKSHSRNKTVLFFFFLLLCLPFDALELPREREKNVFYFTLHSCCTAGEKHFKY